MQPLNNILVSIAALILSAQTFPLNIGRGSFVYNPDSIPQNERILRLYLHLASYTANRLIHLKNDAKLQKALNPHAEAILPAVCRETDDNHERRVYQSRKRYGYHIRPIYNPLKLHSNEKTERLLSPLPELNRTDTTPLNKVTDQNMQSEIFKNSYNPQDDLDSTVDKSHSDKKIVNETKVENNTSVDDSVFIENMTDKSHNFDDSPIESQDKLANLSKGNNRTENSNEVPIEIASRALFNLEKNNYVTHYNDNSRTVNNANTRINNINTQGIPHSGSVMINQNAGNSGFQGHHQKSNSNRVNTEINNSGSGSSGFGGVAQNSGSMMSSQNFQNSQSTKSVSSKSKLGSSGLERTAEKVVSMISNVGDADIVRQAMNATSGLQSGSSTLVNATRSLVAGFQNRAAGQMTRRALNGDSSLQSTASDLMKSAHGVLSKTESAATGISTQALNAGSQLNSMSSGITNSANGVASKTGSAGAGISSQVQNAASQLKSTSSEILNSANGVASKIGSAGAGISTQAQNAGAQLNSMSSGIINSANGVASKTANAGEGISSQVQNAGAQLNSMPSGIINSANGIVSKTGSADAGISTQAKNAASQLQSTSSEIMNSANGVASKTANAAGGGISSQIQNAASQINSISSGILNSANGIASKAQTGATGATQLSQQGLTKTSHIQSSAMQKKSEVRQTSSHRLITNHNRTNRTMTLAGNQRQETSKTQELFGTLNQNKSSGIIKNANEVTSLLKQGTALADSSQAISGKTKTGSGTMDQLMSTMKNTGSNDVQELAKPIMSTAHDSTENVGNLLEGLGGAGSKFTGSVVMQTGSGSKTAFETSFRRGSASSSLMTSGSDGFTQVGSSLIGSIPLFRSFPDVYDKSSTPKISAVDVHSKKIQTEPVNYQISTTERNDDNQELSTIKHKLFAINRSSFDTDSKNNQTEIVDYQNSSTERSKNNQELSTIKENQSSAIKKSPFDNHAKNNKIEVIDDENSSTQHSADKQGISMIDDNSLNPHTTKKSNNPTLAPDSSVFYDEYDNNNDDVSVLELEEYTNMFANALRPMKF